MGKKKKKHIQLGEEKEKLDLMGQESDKKAVKHVKEFTKEGLDEEKHKLDVEKEKTDSKKRYWDGYKSKLGEILYERMKMMDWPFKWRFGVEITKKGVVARFMTSEGRVFHKAVAPVNDLEYDVNAMLIMAEDVENTLDVLTKEEVVVPGSVFGPDGELTGGDV